MNRKGFKEEIVSKFKYWIKCKCSGLSPDDFNDKNYNTALLLFLFELYNMEKYNTVDEDKTNKSEEVKTDDDVIKVNFGE